MVIEITTQSEFERIINSQDRVAVLFWAEWAGPSKMLKSKLEAFAEQFEPIAFITVNIDENSETAEAMAIQAMPTVKFFKNGTEEVSKMTGADEKRLEQKLDQLNSL